jgi:hypothetical protein
MGSRKGLNVRGAALEVSAGGMPVCEIATQLWKMGPRVVGWLSAGGPRLII